jgi:chaperonin GroES
MTTLKIKPLFDKIVLELELERTTAAGIIITAVQAHERYLRGKIIAAGAGRRVNGERVPMGVKMGDRVVFDKYTLSEIKIGNQSVFIGTEEGIVGVLGEAE